ncbi:MAG: response regulator transcription factor [Acidimicrobiaceae bacterium]|nr:response regulator transcription factor [Acidimicrobiaceae bacterium]MXV88817.1 response regulator transcription factor [Acidimicrobiales bacterium]MXX42890.1 response regulator transcription factor [Acidimicrobiales bacterium]MYA81218.1 response regulator transcription factor [Acidimicrobiales bacterium]MYB82682.1 response regulator transcription factor [Acidimicrobiales bacterium]
MTSVLVVDDEPSFTEALTVGLRREGFEVRTAADGRAALAEINEAEPDLVLLDVMLPGMSGLDVCREIRKQSRVPLIMVTARAEEIDAVVGLEVGADDYVAKPYRMRELVARMRAVLRRASEQSPPSQPSGPPSPPSDLLPQPQLIEGDVELDIDRHELRVRGELVTLALREFELLAYLMARAGRVVTRDSLMQNVWGYNYVGDTKTIDVHVKRLRAKIEDDPSSPQRITTIRGLGYRYERSA